MSERSPKPRSSAEPEVAPAQEAPQDDALTIVDKLTSEELREILGEIGGTLDEQLALAHMGPTEEAPAPVAIEVSTKVSITAHMPAVMNDLDMASEQDEPALEEEGPSAEDAAQDAALEGDGLNARKLYHTELSKLEQPAREAMAKSAKDPHLSALCFDPQQQVIARIFDNPSAGLLHALLVARNHHTPQGLDVVMQRAELLRDPRVQRVLLHNTMLQEVQLKRILQPKRLAEIYQVVINREIPEKSRQKSRMILRSKWSMAEGEERAGLVFLTEGRCLQILTGLPFDSHTTSLLCRRTYTSLLLMQSLARFGACPPQVLAHLLKQAIVRRQPQLRTAIMQHPNCPSDSKPRG